MPKLLNLTLIIVISIFTACKKPEFKKYETRAVWMSRFEYAEKRTAEESQQYIRNAFRKFHEAGLNLVIFQVRGNGDAFYKSNFEPWSDMLSEHIGTDPGWDPLQFAIDEARSYALEVHAWINTFPAWKAENPLPPLSEPLHPILAHPEWIACDSLGQPMKPNAGYITFSPGIPAVRQHVQKVVMDIVENYDVEGLHFDYIRYPEGSLSHGYSHDSLSVTRFHSEEGNPTNLSWTDWQREQVNIFVSDVYDRITEIKPWLKVSAAVIGHHHGVDWNGYHAVFQDARRWLATGKMDFIFPMSYTRIGHPTAAYELALQQWRSLNYLGRPIFPGIATYKLGGEYSQKEIYQQLEMVRRHQFAGMVFFSANSLLQILDQIGEKYYFQAALNVPATWKLGVPVVLPLNPQIQRKNKETTLVWGDQNEAVKYVLYRSADISDPRNIIGILPGRQTTYQIAEKNEDGKYYITAINRIGVESKALEFKEEIIARNEK